MYHTIEFTEQFAGDLEVSRKRRPERFRFVG